MKRRIILWGLMMLIAGFVMAQNDSHFSLFEYSQNTYNPGAAGSNNAICVTSMHRQQWVGFDEGHPQTTIFTFDMPIKNIIGIGATFLQDKIGYQNDISFMLNAAYRLETDFGIIGIGAGFGILNRSIDGDWKTPESLEGGTVYSDPLVPHKDSKATYDMNFGATINGENYWGGFSITHLTRPHINFDGVEKASYIPLHYYLAGGYNLSLPNPSCDMLFSGIAQYSSSFEFQVNAKFLYQKKFWGGLSYRFSEAIVPMIGVHLVCGLSIGYSYDVPIGKMKYAYQSGSHEILVRYCFNLAKNNNMGRYRSVRRL